ncbi:putative ankyrin repeat protein RF_0381 [Chelonus insularis]|uniref:putative ankyrin repeat protein RF_0381 n=1 Tax=Chelonus insularis TaxID=460826 RepID=UPI00158BCAF2|nr:putative ankyrin repeat protein RF_0381 [Chelonus insularis]
MSYMANDSDNKKGSTLDGSLSDVNIKVERFYLSYLGKDDQKGILITAETEKSTIEKMIPLKLEHPDHFGLLLLNYNCSESDDYFPLNSTVKVKEILLKKSITESDDTNLEDQRENIIEDRIRHIITRNESDCSYLCEAAIEDKYTVVLQMKLEIIDTNNSYRRLAFYLDDGSSILLCRFEINARSETRETPLHVAVDLNMSDIVDLLISNGANVNATNGLDQVPLHYAAKSDNLNILYSLFNNQAKLDEQDSYGKTPLHYAVLNVNENAVDLLISNGADVDATNSQGQVPLHIAAKKSNLKILKSLLRNQAKLDERDKDDRTALHYAVDSGNENIVDILLKRGANHKLEDKCGLKPFDQAFKMNLFKIMRVFTKFNLKNLTQAGRDSIHLHYDGAAENGNNVDLLISEGADVNATNRQGQIPLHYVAENNNLNILDSLLENKAKLDERDEDGETPLHYVVLNGKVDVVDILLKRGADYKLENKNGLMPFHLAAKQVNLDMIKVFLDNNVDANIVNSRANINFQDEAGNTPLHHAVMNNNREFLQALLECNADPAIKNYFGKNVLHFALTCIGGDNCIQDILDSNVDIDAVNRDGETALHLAIQWNDDNIVKLILKKNPNIDMKNNIGDTALHKTVKRKHCHMVELLLKNGANVNLKDGSEKTVLHLAIELDELNIIPLLLENKANANLKDASGNTVLFLAAKLSKIPAEIIKYILNYTNDIDAKDDCGRTALHYAALNTPDRILEVLLKAKADVYVKDSEGNTPLRLTVSWENRCVRDFKSMKVLVNYQADVNAVDNDMRTPLHHACWNKNEDMSVNCADKFGKTPLHYLVEKSSRFYDFHELLLKFGADINIEDKEHNTVIDILVKQFDTLHLPIAEIFTVHVIEMKEISMWVRKKTLDGVYGIGRVALVDCDSQNLFQNALRYGRYLIIFYLTAQS